MIDFAAALAAEVARSQDYDLFDLLPTHRSSIAPNFKVIDYFDNRVNVAISVKSIDPDAKRYRTSGGVFNANAFEGTVKRCLRELKKVDPNDLHMRAMKHMVELNDNFLEILCSLRGI